MAELSADRSFRGCSVISLVEQQIERPVDGWKSRREVGRRGNVEQPLRCREQFLRTRYPLLNCRMAADEGARDLICAEAAQDVENERDLRLFCQARLAAGEHHTKQIVFDRGGCKEFFDGKSERPFAIEQAAQFRRERVRSALAPQNVERPILCRG